MSGPLDDGSQLRLADNELLSFLPLSDVHNDGEVVVVLMLHQLARRKSCCCQSLPHEFVQAFPLAACNQGNLAVKFRTDPHVERALAGRIRLRPEFLAGFEVVVDGLSKSPKQPLWSRRAVGDHVPHEQELSNQRVSFDVHLGGSEVPLVLHAIIHSQSLRRLEALLSAAWPCSAGWCFGDVVHVGEQSSWSSHAQMFSPSHFSCAFESCRRPSPQLPHPR